MENDPLFNTLLNQGKSFLNIQNQNGNNTRNHYVKLGSYDLCRKVFLDQKI